MCSCFAHACGPFPFFGKEWGGTSSFHSEGFGFLLVLERTPYGHLQKAKPVIQGKPDRLAHFLMDLEVEDPWKMDEHGAKPQC